MARVATGFSQRAIYDERYATDAYDSRSSIRVLTAERLALQRVARRAISANPEVSVVSLIDFGYGTGRVTNEFIATYATLFADDRRNLRVIAYDVSSVGLEKAAENLQKDQEFVPSQELGWLRSEPNGYIVGELKKLQGNVELTVVFVHGSENDSPRTVKELLIKANDGNPCLITTSWYSGLGHIPGEKVRADFFAQLGALTSPTGELVIAVAATGDVVELQNEWSERLRAGNAASYPIEAPGDVIYETELGQLNFWHVFGMDLQDNMRSICNERDSWWVEAIRFPDEEFVTEQNELSNYEKVRCFNIEQRGKSWEADDYRRCHTVAVFRSGSSEPPA